MGQEITPNPKVRVPNFVLTELIHCGLEGKNVAVIDIDEYFVTAFSPSDNYLYNAESALYLVNLKVIPTKRDIQKNSALFHMYKTTIDILNSH